ncbi:MAG: hypothetical protein EHM51_01915 [Geobacter sp.]|nr:MAG: hypothetical protein EHM51_01915 [Geobacter sp.]
MRRYEATVAVRDVMMGFAETTGLASADTPPRRYLWTDAFAVCNFLELFQRTNEAIYRDLALRLVDQVHHILGRHRLDGGWISGLDEQEGELHPTRGGLRIGKSLDERRPGEPLDENLEWDRDGQYFHYLTKWMHALNCVSRVTGDATFLQWAMDLAQAAQARFIYQPSSGGRKRMYWKMSVDLTRPLVPSMGQHDPLDGFVSFLELQAASRNFPQTSFPDLTAGLEDLAAMCRGQSWITDDPLGIGGLLFDAWRVAQLAGTGDCGEANLLEAALDSAYVGLQSFEKDNPLKYQARHRLPFRELGLSIGLKAVGELQKWLEENPRMNLQRSVEGLTQYVPLSELIERFWLDGKNREGETWTDHREINMVMLATRLASDEFLTA